MAEALLILIKILIGIVIVVILTGHHYLFNKEDDE